MPDNADNNLTGSLTSPGGFVFGIQGWTWGDPKPRSITFFLDNTCRVSDQHGRPIKGTVIDNRIVMFAPHGPTQDDPPGARAKYATHTQVIEALVAERVDWTRLDMAGWPQIPYEALKKLAVLPPTPLDELRKIPDTQLRRDALRIRREVDEFRAKETAAVELE